MFDENKNQQFVESMANELAHCYLEKLRKMTTDKINLKDEDVVVALTLSILAIIRSFDENKGDSKKDYKKSVSFIETLKKVNEFLQNGVENV